jgi:FMNH2-dependent dimethyl sulfone monooxygenase
MQFGMFAPTPHITVGSAAMARSVAASARSLREGENDAAVDILRSTLTAADRVGFDVVLFAERHLGSDLEAWMMASAASAWTQRIKLMVAVHPGLWHPQIIAKMTTSLDRLSGGRAAINLVTGWNVEEARMYGGDVMLHDDDRYVRAEEFVAILRGMWSECPFSYKGRFYDVDKAQLLLRPAGALPEIFTASRSPRGLDLVARIADWWFLAFDKGAPTTKEMQDSIARSVADMRERVARYGRTIKIAFNPFVAFGASRDAAMTSTLRLLHPDEPDPDVRKMESRVGPSMRAGCVGTPAQVRETVQFFESIGIDMLLLQYIPTVEQVEAIGRELIAPLRRGG